MAPRKQEGCETARRASHNPSTKYYSLPSFSQKSTSFDQWHPSLSVVSSTKKLIIYGFDLAPLPFQSGVVSFNHGFHRAKCYPKPEKKLQGTRPAQRKREMGSSREAQSTNIPMARLTFVNAYYDQDYSLRAKDFNEKKKRLKILSAKAKERNPDEFSFAMMSSRTRDGGQRVAERGNKALSHDAVRLLKTQDAGYLRTIGSRTRKLVQKAEQAVALGENAEFSIPEDLDDTHSPRHVVFVDSKADQETWMPLTERNSKHGTSRLGNEDGQGSGVDGDAGMDIDSVFAGAGAEKTDTGPSISYEAFAEQGKWRRAQAKRKKALEALRKRETDLRAAELQLELQRARLNHSIGSVNTRNGAKFKIRERKR